MANNNLMVVTRPTKTDNNKYYSALVVRLPYRDVILSYNKNLIAEVLGISVIQLVELCNKSRDIEVGDIGIKTK